jgi:hypothetical protein
MATNSAGKARDILVCIIDEELGPRSALCLTTASVVILSLPARFHLVRPPIPATGRDRSVRVRTLVHRFLDSCPM